jgi:hypothetical protein
MGTKWEYIGSNKNPTHPPSLKGQKNGSFECILPHLIDYKKFGLLSRLEDF